MSDRSYNLPDETFSCHSEVHGGYTNCELYAESDEEHLLNRRRGYYAGQETPKFHQRLQSGGLLPLNAYVRWDYELQANPGNRTWEKIDPSPQVCWYGFNHPYTWGWDGGRIFNGTSPILPDTSGVNWDALTIAAMADVMPDLDALTTAIEAHKTFNMITSARKDAQRLIRQALRGGKHTVKAAADAWMAWRYGWQILALDVSNIYDFIQKPLTSYVVTGQSGTSFTSSLDEYIGHISPRPEGDFERSRSGAWDVSCRARVVGRWDSRTLNAVADPMLSLWESIPYSFVADWFVNIGDVLKAWKVQTATSIMASQGIKADARCNTRDVCHPSDEFTHIGSWSWDEKLQYKSRWPASIPNLVPSIDVQLNSKRIADVAAILSKRIL